MKKVSQIFTVMLFGFLVLSCDSSEEPVIPLGDLQASVFSTPQPNSNGIIEVETGGTIFFTLNISNAPAQIDDLDIELSSGGGGGLTISGLDQVFENNDGVIAITYSAPEELEIEEALNIFIKDRRPDGGSQQLSFFRLIRVVN